MNTTDSTDRDHTFSPRSPTRNPTSPLINTPDHPATATPTPPPIITVAHDNLPFLVSHCAEFQHALAFEMRAAVVAGVASC